MQRLAIRIVPAVLCALLLAPASAMASFHFMQVEQVIGGINGDVERQAVQLRMRQAAQNQVGNARLVAYDAQGLNPVVLVEFPNSVPVSAAGSRVLIATPKFATEPEVVADFLLQRRIPENYIAAGRLTFETHGSLVYWSLCWGGAAYTGSTVGASSNDDDNDFGPCVDGPLPATSRSALLFDGDAADLSTSNAKDYVLAADASFTNNSGDSAVVTNVVVLADGFDF